MRDSACQIESSIHYVATLFSRHRGNYYWNLCVRPWTLSILFRDPWYGIARYTATWCERSCVDKHVSNSSAGPTVCRFTWHIILSALFTRHFRFSAWLCRKFFLHVAAWTSMRFGNRYLTGSRGCQSVNTSLTSRVWLTAPHHSSRLPPTYRPNANRCRRCTSSVKKH